MIIVCSSPKDLYQQLSQMKKSGKKRLARACIVMGDSKIAIHRFAKATDNDVNLSNALAVDAAQLMVMPVEQIASAHAVLGLEEGQQQGIAACAPFALLREYAAVLIKWGVMPLCMVPRAVVRLKHIMKYHAESRGAYMVLDRYDNTHALISVFHQQQCMVVRVPHFETIDEFKKEVANTLLSAAANPLLKEIHSVFVYGVDSQGTVNLLNASLSKHLHCEALGELTDEIEEEDNAPLGINFCYEFIPARSQRTMVCGTLAVVVAGLLLAVAAQGAYLYTLYQQQQTLQSKLKG